MKLNIKTFHFVDIKWSIDQVYLKKKIAIQFLIVLKILADNNYPVILFIQKLAI